MNKVIGNQDGAYSPGREVRWSEGIKLVLDLAKAENASRRIKILDVGCGDGAFYRFLVTKAAESNVDIKEFEYCGLDSDLSFKKKIEALGGRFILSDVVALSKAVGSEKFDVIIASEIIEHIDETDRFIDEIKKVLKRGGYIYLTTPNLAAWHCRLMLLCGFQPLPTEISNISSAFGKGRLGKKYYGAGTIHHIRVFTYRALMEFLQYHGLVIVRTIGGGYRGADRLFKNKFVGLASLIIMVLKKP